MTREEALARCEGAFFDKPMYLFPYAEETAAGFVVGYFQQEAHGRSCVRMGIGSTYEAAFANIGKYRSAHDGAGFQFGGAK